MFNRHRLPLLIGAASLILVSGAGAAESDTFTAASTPTYVQPNEPIPYSVTLTNTSAATEASLAKIGIPPGFTVDEATVNAATNGAGACADEAPWVADGPLVADGKINLKRSGGSANNLCPAGSLVVGFKATAAADGSYAWAAELASENVTFNLTGPQPPIVVDGVAPTVTIGDKPASLTNSRSAAFTFTASEPATFGCRVDSGPFPACASPANYGGLDQGGHTFRVRATDQAGNQGEATYAWTIDLTPPVVAITAKPSNPSSSASASFSFTVNGAVGVACKLDSAQFAPCASPAAYTNIPDGPHSFTVRATDAAGNTGEASYAWTSETRPPTAAVASGPAALSNSRTATLAFTADEPSSFECQLDGGTFAACSSPVSYQSLGDGAHSFSVRPTDAVGNLGASASYGWTIDATAPETTLATGPRSGTTALSATFKFAASEQGTFECRLDGAAFAPCASPKSYSGLRRVGHSFVVRSIDRAGNVDSTPAVHRWTIAAVRRAAKTLALHTPRAGARLTAPPLLAWRRVPRASYYNLQLYRGRVKVLSRWPIRTRVQLRSRWTYLGRKQKLSPGAYRWYVWPGYGPARAHRYGRLLGQSKFTVVAPKTRGAIQ